MTLNQAKTLCAIVHACTLRKTDAGEYRVNLRGGSESSAYYASDLEDAVNTAAAMRRAVDVLAPRLGVSHV
jgi:hypothetical protein